MLQKTRVHFRGPGTGVSLKSIWLVTALTTNAITMAVVTACEMEHANSDFSRYHAKQKLLANSPKIEVNP